MLGSQGFWSDLASLAGIIGAGVVIYAAVVAVRQLKEMARSRNLEAMLRVYELIASKEARASRRFIYTELSSEPDAVTSEELDKIEEVSVTFDRVGALVGAGLVPADLLFASHRDMIIRAWDRLAPYVAYHRLQRYAAYARHFEQLAGLARDNQLIASNESIPVLGNTTSETETPLSARHPSLTCPLSNWSSAHSHVLRRVSGQLRSGPRPEARLLGFVAVRRGPEISAFVVITTGGDSDLILGNLVDEPVFVGDAA
jgi:hypothetical protein